MRSWLLPLHAVFAGCLTLLTVWLVLRPDPHDGLRQADRTFARGDYYAALQQYRVLAATEAPVPALRLGIVYTLRGDNVQAEPALRRAWRLAPRGVERERTLIYLGEVLYRREQRKSAQRFWDIVQPCAELAPDCAYAGVRHVLTGERLLQAGDYVGAQTAYQAAIDAPLSAEWRRVARVRSAQLTAHSDPATALALLEPADPPAQLQAPADPFLAPLLPHLGSAPADLAMILRSAPAQREHVLGQWYLHQGLPALAEPIFTRIAGAAPDDVAAAAYAAYASWRAGDTAGSLDQLEALAVQHPHDARVRTLLALAYVADANASDALAQLEALNRLDPELADAQLAWANWYTMQRDYPQASLAYSRALNQAPEGRRGAYALLVARFHLESGYDECTGGLPAALIAARAAPDSGATWTALAAAHYRCGHFTAAAEAAAEALAREPFAEAAYYRGAALLANGDLVTARAALILASDLAPASDWRRRAEGLLEQVGE